MTVYLNGAFIPIEQAHVSVLDRGFIFGDGVYEVIPVYSRRPFHLSEHLRRLDGSLGAIRLPNPHSDAEWAQIITTLIGHHAEQDQGIYLHITRGAAMRDQAFPDPPPEPTVFAMSNPLTAPPAAQIENGVACITAPDNRWLRCNIKTISLLPNVLLRQTAVDADCAEAILIRDDSFMTEGTSSNIFVVKNSTLIAPPKDNLVLPGTTYDVTLELADASGIPCQVRRISKREVFDADELLLTSSIKEILSITQLDGKPVGSGKPGPIFALLYPLYQQFKRDVMRKNSAEC